MHNVQGLVGLLLVLAGACFSLPVSACTGITLFTKEGAPVFARTIEWGGSNLNSQYVVVPRGYAQQSYVPGAQTGGLAFTAKYGYVGLAVEQKEFIAEGLNEGGLSAGLFYFPGYGQYEAYDSSLRSSTIADLQLVNWMLASFATIDEVKKAVEQVHIVTIDPRASTAHWRIADHTGRQVVLEIIDGKPRFYENELGVLTNSPGFEWQVTNLNNYINLYAGAAQSRKVGKVELAAFGAGSGLLGIPGDVTPPSRFVRAFFYQSTAPKLSGTQATVFQCFQLLNNFDIPIGIEFAEGETVPDLPSATQWTSVTDPTNRIIYYRTMYNSTIRSIDLNTIAFDRVAYQAVPLDAVKAQRVEKIKVR